MAITVCTFTQDALQDYRRVFVLKEDRLGHYAEFRDFFIDTFKLDVIGFDKPGYVAGPSGTNYELIFIGRSGEAFPAGVEIYALVDALEPMDDTAVDRDLWELLRWIFGTIGGEWSVAALDDTGRLYRIPAVQ